MQKQWTPGLLLNQISTACGTVFEDCLIGGEYVDHVAISTYRGGPPSNIAGAWIVGINCSIEGAAGESTCIGVPSFLPEVRAIRYATL